MLARALGLERARLVSLCGAGGKTTLMLALAAELAAAGERVLITTTTKIARDEAVGTWPAIAAAGAEEVLDLAGRMTAEDGAARPGALIAYAKSCREGERLAGFAPEVIDTLKQAPRFDRILVEADGSARKPLKAPARHEPVIPSTTDVVIVVAGLSGVGCPLDDEHLFRPEIWARLTGIALGSPVTARSVAAIATHADGLTKGCPEHAERILFLNQVDAPGRRTDAKTICELVGAARTRNIGRIVCGRLLPRPEIVHIASFAARP